MCHSPQGGVKVVLPVGELHLDPAPRWGGKAAGRERRRSIATEERTRTQDLDRGPKLVRDDESRNACSEAFSNLRPSSTPGAHQSMLYYDI